MHKQLPCTYSQYYGACIHIVAVNITYIYPTYGMYLGLLLLLLWWIIRCIWVISWMLSQARYSRLVRCILVFLLQFKATRFSPTQSASNAAIMVVHVYDQIALLSHKLKTSLKQSSTFPCSSWFIQSISVACSSNWVAMFFHNLGLTFTATSFSSCPRDGFVHDVG